MSKKTFIIIAGFGLTGSSAALDLLKEYSSVKVYDTELRFITDPDGILSLEEAIVNSWSPYRTDMAIKRFQILVENLTDTLSNPYTLTNHSIKINPSFKQISEEYISQLISFTYSGTWYGINNPLMAIFGYFNKKVGKELINTYKEIFVSYKQEEFVEITRNYIKKIFSPALRDESIKHIVIDEGFSSLHPSRVMKFFENCKMIIVKRDPRDNYLNAKNRRRFIPQKVDEFIKWYKFCQEESLKESRNENILRVYFEDMVLNYKKTKMLFSDFLSLNLDEHVSPNKYFDPSRSKRVVGLWKNTIYQNEVKKIHSNLSEYCYNKGSFSDE